MREIALANVRIQITSEGLSHSIEHLEKNKQIKTFEIFRDQYRWFHWYSYSTIERSDRFLFLTTAVATWDNVGKFSMLVLDYWENSRYVAWNFLPYFHVLRRCVIAYIHVNIQQKILRENKHDNDKRHYELTSYSRFHSVIKVQLELDRLAKLGQCQVFSNSSMISCEYWSV